MALVERKGSGQLIGIISDTHDNMDAIRDSVELLNSKGVSLVIHAGDLIAPFVVPEFAKLEARFVGVFGNNDGEKVGLNLKFKELDVKLSNFEELEYKGKRIAIYHGTIQGIADALSTCDIYDIVILGHSHEAGIKKQGSTTVINPGEACGYLSGKRTLCLFNLEKMEGEIVEF